MKRDNGGGLEGNNRTNNRVNRTQKLTKQIGHQRRMDTKRKWNAEAVMMIVCIGNEVRYDNKLNENDSY